MLFSLLLALSAEATTTSGEARACINNHVSESYQAGWRVRNVSAFEVTQDNNRYMLLDLVGEVEYRFVSCGDDRASPSESWSMTTWGGWWIPLGPMTMEWKVGKRR